MMQAWDAKLLSQQQKHGRYIHYACIHNVQVLTLKVTRLHVSRTSNCSLHTHTYTHWWHILMECMCKHTGTGNSEEREAQLFAECLPHHSHIHTCTHTCMCVCTCDLTYKHVTFSRPCLQWDYSSVSLGLHTGQNWPMNIYWHTVSTYTYTQN